MNARAARARIRRSVMAVGSRLGSHEWTRRLLYAMKNRLTFEDLYQHDRMLADRVRMGAYRRAIARHVQPGDVVVDLGTGTGILAFLAARAGARLVHAIEHGETIEHARAVARANGITNIVFHRTHSTRFELPERADIILHEQIGDALFDERVVEHVADLRRRVLKPGGRILPSRLELFIEPVQLAEGFESPFLWEENVDGISFRVLEAIAAAQPHRYRYRVFRPFPHGHFLCRPEAVVRTNLATAVPADLPRRVTYEREIVAGGRLDGFCVYFRAGFDDQHWFTNSPLERPTSWATPFLRISPRPVEPGEQIRFTLDAGNLQAPSTWAWRLE
jgi:type I protein arginine methyltransferase